MSSPILTCNGFKALIMEADRLVGENIHGLPPGSPLQVYEVDSFNVASPSWMAGEGAYVVPVKPNKGLWFDWTKNDQHNTAILPSVKGCNPITGLPIDGFKLEQYTKCPTHGCELTKNRTCPKCGYTIPPQNYVAPPNTLWWDGFRSGDGHVRQFFFTEDMMRDMASALVGKENTVPAFGFAFYSRKEKYDPVQYWQKYHADQFKGGYLGTTTTITTGYDKAYLLSKSSNNMVNYDNILCSYTCDINTPQSNSEHVFDSMPRSASAMKSSLNLMDEDTSFMDVRGKEVAVGAGAKIHQALAPDTLKVSEWSDNPEAVMRVYFVFEDEFNKYAQHGFKTTPRSDGMLAGLPVG